MSEGNQAERTSTSGPRQIQKAIRCPDGRFNTAKANLSKIEKEISRKELSRTCIRQFLDTLWKQKDIVTAFDAVQFQSLVDFITVYSKDDIRVTFKNGMEIKA